MSQLKVGISTQAPEGGLLEDPPHPLESGSGPYVSRPAASAQHL